MHLRPFAFLTLVWCLITTTSGAELHHEDHRACSTCNAALARSMDYLRKNFDKQVATDGWYAGMLNSFWGGFAFLIDGNSPKEAKVCADRMRFYLETWAKKGMGYDGWFASMSMLYMSEYCLRYGATPELKDALEFGAKFAHKMGYATADGLCQPGISVFQKDGKRIVRVSDAHLGPYDDFCAIWHLFDMLPQGANSWRPAFKYPVRRSA